MADRLGVLSRAVKTCLCAVLSTHLPSALRTFLLTLAVVDDLLAILIIALFYTADLALVPLLGALGPLAAFALLVRTRARPWWLLAPLAVVTWALVHASGVHATVAGVTLGLTVPVLRGGWEGGPDAGPGLAEHYEHRWRAWPSRCSRSSPRRSPSAGSADWSPP